MSDKINNVEIQIDGYNVVRHDRPDGRRGGGVCMYIRTTLFFNERLDFTSNTPVEAAWVELKMENSNILLCCMYRPSNANCEYFNEILDMLDNTSMEGLDIALFCDLNNPIHLIES